MSDFGFNTAQERGGHLFVRTLQCSLNRYEVGTHELHQMSLFYIFILRLQVDESLTVCTFEPIKLLQIRTLRGHVLCLQ